MRDDQPIHRRLSSDVRANQALPSSPTPSSSPFRIAQARAPRATNAYLNAFSWTLALVRITQCGTRRPPTRQQRTMLSLVTNPFASADGSYSRVRPAYPTEVLDLLDALALPGSTAPRAVDLGAGTGKMTAMLLQRGWAVDAIEPAEAMHSQLASSPFAMDPRLTIHAASAEASGLPADCADLVIAAQAWHWFDPPAASAEAARLLTPGGHLVIVFNQMDVSIPWVHRLTRIMRSGDVHRPDRPPRVGAEFGEPHLHLVHWEDEMTTDQVMELARTRSSWIRQDAAGRARMQDNLRWYLHEHLGYAKGSTVTIPYSTLVWTTPLRA